MGAKRVLFLDDRSDRIIDAVRHYALPKYELTCVFTIRECIKKLSNEGPWDIISLDHDLNFEEFEDSSIGTGMEIIWWINENLGFLYGEARSSEIVTTIIIHSSNKAASHKMLTELLLACDEYNENHGIAPFLVVLRSWKYLTYYNSIVTGAFDVIHPEYIRLFKEAKRISSFLTVALNVNKPNQVLSADEREEILWSIRYVDNVVRYHSEEELTEILINLKNESQNRLIRVSGDDHKGKSTREHLNIDYHYKEYGEWSATKIKKAYGESVNG